MYTCTKNDRVYKIDLQKRPTNTTDLLPPHPHIPAARNKVWRTHLYVYTYTHVDTYISTFTLEPFYCNTNCNTRCNIRIYPHILQHILQRTNCKTICNTHCNTLILADCPASEEPKYALVHVATP